MVKADFKVLLIAGEGRSGSTLLGNILGQADGFFFASELRSIWDEPLCGCGVPFRQCDLWEMVLRRAYGDDTEDLARRMWQTRENGFKARYIPFSEASRRVRGLLRARMEDYTGNLESLYQAIQDVTQAKVIVDSSSHVSHAYILRLFSSLDVYMLHLIRDSRGVAYSWKKRKETGQAGKYMVQRSATRSTILWSVANMLGELVGRHYQSKYMRIRYEDFVAEPESTLLRIADLLGEDPTRLPTIESRRVRLNGNHGIGGNANRFKTGDTELRIDDVWRKKMRNRDKGWVTLLSLPLLLRYGYLSLGSA